MNTHTIHLNPRHRNPRKEINEDLTRLDKAALAITNKIGTFGTFIIISIWSGLWVLWNILAPDNLRFDPAPAFVICLLISNFIQLMLMPLIMIAQNLEARHAEHRAEFDHQLAIHTGKDTDLILEKLDKLLSKK